MAVDPALLIPATLQAEIAACTGLPAAEVAARWDRERAALGSNVRTDCIAFGVTPHHYNAAMERLYCEGLGFIFETLAYWIRPERQAWSTRGLARLQRYCRAHAVSPSDLPLLILGDGSGSDTLLLHQHGFRPDYFDVPGSRTSDFARCRFAHHGVAVTCVDHYPDLLDGRYQALWSFDVLEHLPDLPAAVHDISRMLADDGIALITESCGYVREDLPTHLACNQTYAGRLPQLFSQVGLYLRHFTPHTDYRPCEYRKRNRPRLSDRWLSLRLTRKVRRGSGR